MHVPATAPCPQARHRRRRRPCCRRRDPQRVLLPLRHLHREHHIPENITYPSRPSHARAPARPPARPPHPHRPRRCTRHARTPHARQEHHSPPAAAAPRRCRAPPPAGGASLRSWPRVSDVWSMAASAVMRRGGALRLVVVSQPRGTDLVVCMYICLSVCLSIYLSIHLSISLSLSLSIAHAFLNSYACPHEHQQCACGGAAT